MYCTSSFRAKRQFHLILHIYCTRNLQLLFDFFNFIQLFLRRTFNMQCYNYDFLLNVFFLFTSILSCLVTILFIMFQGHLSWMPTWYENYKNGIYCISKNKLTIFYFNLTYKTKPVYEVINMFFFVKNYTQ